MDNSSPVLWIEQGWEGEAGNWLSQRGEHGDLATKKNNENTPRLKRRRKKAKGDAKRAAIKL
jgi:hypothetical protein